MIEGIRRKPGPSGRIQEWWHGYDRPLRIVAIALWCAAFAIGSVGIALDIGGRWSKLPFATNLVSSLVGACFGIPIALFGLQALASSQNRIAERRLTASLAARVASNFRQSADDLMNDYELDSTEHQSVRYALFGISGDDQDDLRREMNLADPLDSYELSYAFLVKFLDEVRSVLPWIQEMPRRISTVRATWSVLLNDIRWRVSEYDLPWLEEYDIHTIDQRLERIASPDAWAWFAELTDCRDEIDLWGSVGGDPLAFGEFFDDSPEDAMRRPPDWDQIVAMVSAGAQTIESTHDLIAALDAVSELERELTRHSSRSTAAVVSR